MNLGTFGASGQFWKKHNDLIIQMLELEDVVVEYVDEDTEPESGNVNITGRSIHFPIDGADYNIIFESKKLENDAIGVKLKLIRCDPLSF